MTYRRHRSKAWDGIGVWSSHPVENPARKNLRSFGEILALMHWDERFARAYRLAIKDYWAAGAPGIPWGATDYRKQYRKQYRIDPEAEP